ncbi:uncharacterized protein KQ657_003491 [Scheffersomyces spartinae]|uniref:SCP domain-containing protein n=1 Tax=Scheffersomyces spartinae TaxID=45513 RepID=A0A9P7V579_9ASCO|nr:uncharacterized protein KQ657_003491 [Scheffersomyces spartinae]KAG7191370.1 hypothetical protein KQ657_003491 [Scheffersomyces spartinae]
MWLRIQRIIASTSALTSFESDILDAHNQKRALHGVPALKWNAKIAAYAAAYAAVALDCNNLQLVHSGGPYGENLAAGYVGGYSPVDAWYNEIKLYNYSQPGFSPATGHFTQVVWKSTTELGCAMLLCNNAWRQYTICEYTNTRGNIVGTNPATGNNFFVDNVLPPLDGNYIHKRNVFT